MECQGQSPAFLYHVGDVVYFYGEENFYYSQFYEPFQYYPAPIFAIPGNHDGIVYQQGMVSLESFQQAFCAAAPGQWEGTGGILRSTMTQPGVYFTLETPLVSIVGLYSNCSESRYLPKPDPVSSAIDKACEEAGLWPDVVMCGHAHLYQRFLRTVARRKIPYVINGAGGYAIKPMQKLGGANVVDSKVILKEGYVRATVDASTMRLEYNAVAGDAAAKDAIVIDLKNYKVQFEG